MSDKENELSDEEYEALLRDLEGRADGGGGSVSDGDDDLGDIDDFLNSLDSEAEESAGKSVKTATDDGDDLAAQFASLEQKGELTAPPESAPETKKSKSKGKEKKKKSKGQKESGDDGEPSRGKRAALFAAKNAVWLVPALALWWVLGVYLAQWVSAGWLIALVGAGAVFGLPVILKKAVKRGGYRIWAGGLALVATVALIAPMPNTAGENMAQYGHWPSSTIAELIPGQASDSGLVLNHASATGWLGAQVATSSQTWEARQLGTIFPLGMEWPPEELMPLIEGDIELSDIEEALEAQGIDGAATGEALQGTVDAVNDAADGIEDAAGQAEDMAQEAEDVAGEVGE